MLLTLHLALLGFISGVFSVLDDETKCLSRFDYEFKIVQKLVELEIKTKEQQEAINALSQKCAVQTKPQQEIAFSAYLTVDVTGGHSLQVIVFNEIQTNIGGAYNSKTGTFVCKYAGVYVFYWVITNKNRTYMDSELVVNGEERSKAFSDAGGHDDYAVASNALVVELKFGDQVWIRVGTYHNGQLAGERRSSFSGWLLYSR